MWEYLRREKFLFLLILLFLILSILDQSLPGRSLGLVDYESLAAITSFFVVSRGLELSGIFSRVARKIVTLSGNSEFRVLCMLVVAVFLSSAVIMNDTAIFVFVPIALALSRASKVDLPKTVTLVALAANAGSALSPLGNPQNIIIWRTYRLSIWHFVGSMLPYVAVWFLVLLAYVWIVGRKRLEVHPMPGIRINPSLAATSALLLAINVVLVEVSLSPVGLLLTVIVMAVIGREALFAFDFTLIAVFALIFINFREISHLLPEIVMKCTAAKAVLLSAGLSQLISNVPATVLLSPHLPWLPLAVGVNLGGNGIVIGSLANFIAVRISGIRLRDFHRYSLPYFMITLALTYFLILSSTSLA